MVYDGVLVIVAVVILGFVGFLAGPKICHPPENDASRRSLTHSLTLFT